VAERRGLAWLSDHTACVASHDGFLALNIKEGQIDITGSFSHEERAFVCGALAGKPIFQVGNELRHGNSVLYHSRGNIRASFVFVDRQFVSFVEDGKLMIIDLKGEVLNSRSLDNDIVLAGISERRREVFFYDKLHQTVSSWNFNNGSSKTVFTVSDWNDK